MFFSINNIFCQLFYIFNNLEDFRNLIFNIDYLHFRDAEKFSTTKNIKYCSNFIEITATKLLQADTIKYTISFRRIKSRPRCMEFPTIFVSL